MTFDALRECFLRFKGEVDGNQTETNAVIMALLADEYWDLIRETLCTWRKPALVSIAVKTATTNYYDLYTLLGLSAGQEVMFLDKVIWDGSELPVWSKGRVDQSNQYGNVSGQSKPDAYAFYTEWAVASNAELSYLAFAPFITTANTTDCYISYVLRPAQPTESNMAEVYPMFDERWHTLLAERAAWKALRALGDDRATVFWAKQISERTGQMKLHYYEMRNQGDLMPPPAFRRVRPDEVRFYGS